MADTPADISTFPTDDMRIVRVTFKTPMKWTIERLNSMKEYVNETFIEQEINLIFLKSEPNGTNWWLGAVTPHQPEKETSMYMWFHRRFGRARYRAQTELTDLESWQEWNAGIIEKNPTIETIEVIVESSPHQE